MESLCVEQARRLTYRNLRTDARRAEEQLTRSVTITTYDPTPESPTVVVTTGDAAAAGDAGRESEANGGASSGREESTVRMPVPSRPGIVSPQELPPQFE